MGGSLSGGTYAYSKLRFSNGSKELNITEAGNATYGWIDLTIKNRACQTLDRFGQCTLYGFGDVVSGDLNSWQGYFIYSNYNNISLIRQN